MSNQLMSPKQASDFLNVTTSALKKYALLLEANGYAVSRNELNYRMYSGQDIAMIRAMLILNRLKSVQLEDAASIVTSSDTDIQQILEMDGAHDGTNNDVLPVTQSQITDVSAHLTGLISSLQSEIQDRDALHTQLLAAIDDKLSVQRDINTQLMEQNELLLAKLEALEHKYEEERKRSVWSKMFGK